MIEEALDGLVNGEALRNRGDLLADLAQRCERDAGIAAARVLGIARRLEAGPAAVEPVGLVGLVALRRLEFGVEPGAPVGLHLVDFAGGNDAFGDQLLAV